MLTGSNVISTNALLMMHSPGDEKGKTDAKLFKRINVAFMDEMGNHLLRDWGVEVKHLIVTEIKAADPEVQQAMAAGVRMSIEAAGMKESALLTAETARITAEGDAVVARIKTAADAHRIREIAKAQADAGRILEDVPTAVTIRLAEAGTEAIGKAGSVIVVKDVGMQGLLALTGAGDTKK